MGAATGIMGTVRADPSILHVDLDAFFAAVEQRDKPSLRGKPVVVGGVGGRGVVATASYEARAFGIRSAMSTREARARCPHAAFLTGRFAAYRESSSQVMALLRELSPLVEPLSLDEAFVDLRAGAARDLSVAGVTELARRLKEDVAEVTGGLCGSVGVASSKLVAKIASDLDKPDGLVVVPPGTEQDLLRPMSVSVIPGVGPATAERLRRVGVHTVSELEAVSPEELVRLVGQAHGTSLYRLARAADDRPVVAEREAKSVSVEDTYDTDLVDRRLLEGLLDRQSSKVTERLRKARLSGRTVTVKVRLHDFSTHTRSTTLTGPTDSTRVVARLARALLAEVDTSGGVRLLGVGVSGLADWIQEDLFGDGGGGDGGPDGRSEAEPGSAEPADSAPPPDLDRLLRGRRWSPGMDVVHAEQGRGWVWGSGIGRVTVRFETAQTGPGPVRTFAASDPALTPTTPSPPRVGYGRPMDEPRRDQATADQQPSDSTGGRQGASGRLVPPLAPVHQRERTHHGDTVLDPYEWLRDKESPETLAYLEAENAYTEGRTAHLAGLREAIFTEIKSRTQETDLSVPARVGSFWYYSRSVEGKQYGISCRCPVADPDDWAPPALDPSVPVPGEEVLLDSNELAEGHDFFSLGGATVTPDGSLLAFSTDTVGDERFLLRVKDLRTGELLPDEVPGTLGGATWDLKGTVLFYATVDETWRPDKIWRHTLGTPVSEDAVVHHETDERFWTSVGRTRSDRYLLVVSGSKLTTECRVLDADSPTGDFRVLAPRREGVEYGVEHAVIAGQDRFLVLHNDGAENYAIASTPVDATSHAQWEPFVEHDPDVRLEDVDAFATHLVVSQRRGGLTQLRVLLLDARGVTEDYEIPFDEPVYTVGATGNPEFEQPRLRLAHTTLSSPAAVYDFDVRTRQRSLLKRTPVLGDFDPDRYEQHREWAVAEDGTRVPISLVCPKDAPRDGTMPLLLYGYGSYEASMDPYFSIARLSLLDRGVGFAIAHVRGGGEMGRRWYDQGKVLHKRNTFTDFVTCARHLVDTGWSAPDLLLAEGASAGGLLMGAVANLAPDLFAGIVAGVPFVDALTSILDPSLPLTVIEWEEWGNPLEDPEVYAYMKSYTPYENIEARRYPPILAETSLNDTRVLYVEPAKWVARLRTTIANPEDVLLKTEMSAGHGGVSGRYNAWKDRAFTLAWMLDRVGRASV